MVDVHTVNATPLTSRSAQAAAMEARGARASCAAPNTAVAATSSRQLARDRVAAMSAPTSAPAPKNEVMTPNVPGPACSVSEASTGSSTWKLKQNTLSRRIIPRARRTRGSRRA